jgi:AraC family transcriptional regulator, regulatory protein of adaptative response / methylated-DNA-[protein]-cysteine methyltransferase
MDNFDTFYQAILDKNTAYEGVFITAVTTTGIFCRPICTARKPKKENVVFYKTTDEAMSAGYRACKVCSPLANLHETPDYIKSILDELKNNPSVKIKDSDLIEKGIEPHTIRRWFLKNHGVTFHVFQRKQRIYTAFNKIQAGETVTNTAFSTGFESLSGFGDSFKSAFGVSPKNSKKKK